MGVRDAMGAGGGGTGASVAFIAAPESRHVLQKPIDEL